MFNSNRFGSKIGEMGLDYTKNITIKFQFLYSFMMYNVFKQLTKSISDKTSKLDEYYVYKIK